MSSMRELLERLDPGIHLSLKELPAVFQNALKAVGLGRQKDIRVQRGDTFRPNEGSALFEGNRGFIIVVNMATGQFKIHYGAWSGPSPYDPRQVDLDRKPQKIPKNGAVIIGESGGRGKFARIRVHPDNFSGIIQSHEKEVSDQERAALAVIGGIISKARGEYFERAKLGRYGADNEIIKELAKKRLIKISRSGAISITTSGKNARGDARPD